MTQFNRRTFGLLLAATLPGWRFDMGWDPVSDIRGPQGEQGVQGDPGPKGDKGDPGLVTTQAELEAALSVGGDIYCDSSVTINLTSRMDITHPTRLTGGRFTRTTGEAFRITSSDVEISGVSITGGGGTTYSEPQKLIRAVGTSSNRLRRINIHDCILRDSRGDNVWMEWCEASRVTGNVIHDFLYSGVMVLSGDGITVSNNDIANAPLTSGVVNTYGIAFTDLDNTMQARCRNSSATGNRVHLIDWEGIDTHGGDNIVITGNIVTACPRGIALVAGNPSRVAAPTRCVVSGNRVDGAGMRQSVREGIGVHGATSSVLANATVTGNNVSGYGSNPLFTDMVNHSLTFIGGNNVPYRDWTNLSLTGGHYNHNSVYSMQWRLDGKTVHLRGGGIPSAPAPPHTPRELFGTIQHPAARPSELTFLGYIKGSNAGAGNGMLAVQPDGRVQLLYTSGTDAFSYFLNGSFTAV